MSRRRGRETALQVLFQLDMTGEAADPGPVLDRWGEEFAVPAEDLSFARELVQGTLAHRTEIDEKLARIAAGWHLERMANVDRNVLRLTAFEILFRPDIPRPVSLNEGIELAKLFGGNDSAKFVNGVLDKLVGD
ncbi:hypothetical protein CEB3_c23000 [Peptococcaceae bacterium CEB3]|nr:hypothetical protein CEB3_c23000 [Peptococcaceae bacterium CEB3]